MALYMLGIVRAAARRLSLGAARPLGLAAVSLAYQGAERIPCIFGPSQHKQDGPVR